MTLFTDGAGRAFIPHDALERVAGVANAPVYVAVDQYLDSGVVGGHVYSVGTHGRQAAEIGARILRSGTATSIPVIEQGTYADIFDLMYDHLPRGDPRVVYCSDVQNPY